MKEEVKVILDAANEILNGDNNVDCFEDALKVLVLAAGGEEYVIDFLRNEYEEIKPGCDCARDEDDDEDVDEDDDDDWDEDEWDEDEDKMEIASADLKTDSRQYINFNKNAMEHLIEWVQACRPAVDPNGNKTKSRFDFEDPDDAKSYLMEQGLFVLRDYGEDTISLHLEKPILEEGDERTVSRVYMQTNGKLQFSAKVFCPNEDLVILFFDDGTADITED